MIVIAKLLEICGGRNLIKFVISETAGVDGPETSDVNKAIRRKTKAKVLGGKAKDLSFKVKKARPKILALRPRPNIPA